MLRIPLIILVLFATLALSQTSLFIPGFDPQPLSADILGVDAQGRTTWAVHAGSPTDTFNDSPFPGTATLVEGPSDASLTFAAPGGEFTMDVGCTISDSIAVCSAPSDGSFAVDTITVDYITVQGGTTAPAISTGSATTSQPSQSSQPSQTSGSASAPSSTSNARGITPYFTTLLALTAFVIVMV